MAIDVTYELADEDQDSIAKSNISNKVSDLYHELLGSPSDASCNFLVNVHAIPASPSQGSRIVDQHDSIIHIDDTKYSIDEEIQDDIAKYKK